MKDNNGLYYYPFPNNKRIRMYVKHDSGEVYFRLWNQDDPKMWKEHGWVPHEAILQAGKLYEGDKFNPNDAYDIGLAKDLIEKEG